MFGDVFVPYPVQHFALFILSSDKEKICKDGSNE